MFKVLFTSNIYRVLSCADCKTWKICNYGSKREEIKLEYESSITHFCVLVSKQNRMGVRVDFFDILMLKKTRDVLNPS
jgi:hypothetical protein